eukprot:5713382-Amphidinium_carterae.2
MSRGNMLPPPCTPCAKAQLEPTTGAASTDENISERAGSPVDQRLPLLAMPCNLNFDTWVQWLLVQTNDWANFAIIDGSCHMCVFRRQATPCIEVIMRWNHDKHSWFKLP